jgi:hypothetical protein
MMPWSSREGVEVKKGQQWQQQGQWLWRQQTTTEIVGAGKIE